MKNPLSLDAFADWCERQPPEKEYDYKDYKNCASAQYADFLGVPRRTVLNLDQPHLDLCASYPPYTFGALTKRLRGTA